MTNSHITGAVKEITDVMAYAEEQLKESKRIQQSNPEEFTNAQMKLEEANMELDNLLRSASAEDRDELFRLQQRVHQLQNKMILGI
ncbi:DUF2524 family protein [Evansella clarkii]|uniref:DUF2524 family protein n=1 Tax=Evansella clarkii TaxID=79879 RepID=UPI000B442966|nr:DUF2524 family protein [Evansella clarkii]